MHYRISATLCILLAGAWLPASAGMPPKREVRAVWIATAAGLDWPRSLDPREQQSSLRAMIDNLRALHFNTIFFQVRARGDAYYRSTYDPWAENLTGTFGKDPGWDPLQLVIDEAHRAGMEVHAWFNVFKVRNGAPAVLPEHYPRSMIHWCSQYRKEVWLDPGNPAVRQYLLADALELISRYDLDGINFDYLRYPGRDFLDAESYQRYGRGIPRDEWRRQNLTAFVSEFYDRATAIKPMLKIGSSPLGQPEDVGNALGSVSLYYQDAAQWVRLGKQDYLSPQLYWGLQETPGRPSFLKLLALWEERCPGRQIYAGIGAYRPDVTRELGAQIDSVRTTGADGEAFFRYENIADAPALRSRFATPAFIPPMPWKDSVRLSPPANLAVTEMTPGIFQLEWTPPPAGTDGDAPRSYAIYRSATPRIQYDDPRSIVAITPGSRNFYIDTVKVPSGVTFSYAVSAFDRGNNESGPSAPGSGIIKEVLAMKRKLVNITSLSAAIQRRAGLPNFISYKLGARTKVSLTISQLRDDGSDTLWASLVEGLQEGGTYVVGLGAGRFLPGRYLVRLSTGDNTIEQPIELPR